MENTQTRVTPGSHEGHTESDLPLPNQYYEGMFDDNTKTFLQSYFDIRCQLFRTKFFDLQNKKERGILTGLSRTAFFKEYGILNMDFGRQTGSSYWHSYFLHECEKIGARTMSLFHNGNMQRRFHENFRSYYRDKDLNYKYCIGENQHLRTASKGDVPCDIFRGYAIDFLIIDVSALYKPSQIEKIIEYGGGVVPGKFIIML